MRVYDLQALQSAAHAERGVARYVGEVATALARDHPDAVDVFAWNERLPLPARLGEMGLGERLQPFSALRGRSIDLLHVGSPFELLPYGRVGVPVRADKLVVTCYDLIPYRFPDAYLADPESSHPYRTRLGMLAAADAIVTDSASAAHDVHDMLAVPWDRLTVLGAGVGDQFVPPVDPIDRQIATLRRSFPLLCAAFVLVPTGVDWRKNIPGAIAAFGSLPRELQRRHQLVLACKVDDHQRAWIESLAVDAGISDRVITTGYVSDDDLVRLYQAAELVFFPSYYEGFGLPVLEARRCGARVICSDTSSLPEVLPDPRARFDPTDVASMSASLASALSDPAYAALLDAVPDPGFTWARCADQVAEVYERVLATRHRRPAVERPRRSVAFATLLPPTPSGIADHSDLMARAMALELDDVDVTVYVPEISAAMTANPYPVDLLAALPARWQRGDHDAVLYCFGNNQLHRDHWQTMQVVPGSALLHDVRLTGLFDVYQRTVYLRESYGIDGDVGAAEVLMARPVAEVAVEVLVQSQHAAALVERDTGRRPVRVGPHACEHPVELGPDAPHGVPRIVSAGIADVTKGSATVVGAMCELARRRDVCNSVVGLGWERFVHTDDPIEMIGRVGPEEFRERIARADLLVQLRTTTNGESSGVVAQAMAYGVPLVVTDIGAMAELPDDVALKVPIDISPPELATVIEELLVDTARRGSMREAALRFASRETPAAQARRLVDALFG